MPLPFIRIESVKSVDNKTRLKALFSLFPAVEPGGLMGWVPVGWGRTGAQRS